MAMERSLNFVLIELGAHNSKRVHNGIPQALLIALFGKSRPGEEAAFIVIWMM